MAKYKSPGQKRKGIVRVVSLLIFLAATYAASMVMGSITASSLEWIESHKEVVGNVIAKNQEEEEYRNLKGRKRYRDVYTLTYGFVAEGRKFQNDVEVDQNAFSAYKTGDDIDVWYAENDPDINDTKSNVESAVADNNPVGNMIGVAPYTAPASLFLYWLLSIVFVRESKKVLPTGFYTETSWLDIDDNYVVAIDGVDLVFFDINAKQAGKVQDAYQRNAPLEELVAISKSSKFKRISMNEITELESEHNSDIFRIKHGEDYHSVEFLNQTVKAHALEVVKKLIPESLEYSIIKKTRLQAVMPSLIFLVVLLVVGVVADIFLLNLLLGFIGIVWVLPKVFSRAIDPTVTEKWSIAAKAGQ